MNEDSKNRMQQYYDKLIENQEDGESREIPAVEYADTDGEDR